MSGSMLEVAQLSVVVPATCSMHMHILTIVR